MPKKGEQKAMFTYCSMKSQTAADTTGDIEEYHLQWKGMTHPNQLHFLWY